MFKIQITGATQKHMDILGIDGYPFTTKELQVKFRELTKKYHPDVSKEKNANEIMAKINKAYSYLKALATIDESGINNPVETLKDDPDESIFSRKLYEVCKRCSSKGKIEIPWFSTECKKCCNFSNRLRGGRPGVVALKCKACDDGMFTLRSGHKVPCRKCDGTGYFKAKCNHCYGNPFGTYEKRTQECPDCNGSGKVKMDLFNPVIPEGAVL